MAVDILINGGRPFHLGVAGHVGLTPKVLTVLVRRGVLRRPLRAVYVDAHVPDTRDLRIDCLRLVLPHRAVIWGRTVAWLWGIDSFARVTGSCWIPSVRFHITVADRVTPTCVLSSRSFTW